MRRRGWISWAQGALGRLLYLLLAPLVVLIAFVVSKRVRLVVRLRLKRLLSRVMRRVAFGLAVGAVLAALLAISGLWVYSHFDSAAFGECHRVPLRVGTTAYVADCQAFGPADFAVPFAVVLFLLVVVLGRDISFATRFGTVKIRREAADAAERLKAADIERTADEGPWS